MPQTLAIVYCRNPSQFSYSTKISDRECVSPLPEGSIEQFHVGDPLFKLIFSTKRLKWCHFPQIAKDQPQISLSSVMDRSRFLFKLVYQ